MSKVSKWDELQRSWVIAMKDMKIYYLRPAPIMFGVMFPFTLFLSFAVGRDVPIAKLAPLLLAQTLFWASSSVGPVSIPVERRVRTFGRYLSAPLSLVSVLFGKTLAGVLYGLSISTLAVALCIFAFGTAITDAFVLILGMGLASLGFSAMGIMFASIPTQNPGEVMMPMNFIRIPMLFISGLYIPVSQLPTIGQAAAFLSPLTHTLDLMEYGLGGSSHFGIPVNVAVLVLYTLLFIGIGISFHRRIMKTQ